MPSSSSPSKCTNAVYQGSYGSVHVIAGSGDGKTQLLQHLIAPNGITRPCRR
jgi:hypothetical protein